MSNRKEAMNYYVKRTSNKNPAGYSFVGPIASEHQANREAGAWRDCGENAIVLEATPELKMEVRRWDRVTKADDAREIVTFQGEQMTMAAYRLSHEQAA